MIVIPSTIAAPASITLLFKNPVFGPNLSLATEVTASVLRRDGTTASFTFTIVSATPSELVAQYTFAPGDITITGMYYLAPSLTVPGGSVPGETISMFVASPFSTQSRLQQDVWIMATTPIASLGPVRQNWTLVTPAQSPYAGHPFSPWIALDLSTGAITVTLWHGLDGDSVVISDVMHAAATHNATVNGTDGQQIPSLAGAYATSQTYSTSGFSLRLKYSTATSLWMPW